MDKDLLDLKDSTLLLEGNKTEQKKWSKKIGNYARDLDRDKSERIQIYKKRRDFYTGNQGSYSNITGIIRDTKQKKGHTNQVTNYAGKTIVKMAFALANNPPKLSTTPADINDGLETVRAQAVEDYIDSVFEHRRNKFWKKSYRRAVFHQGEYGDTAIKCYPEVDKKEVCIELHDDMSTIIVGWNGNPGDYDFVIVENYITPESVFDKYGIVVDKKALGKIKEDSNKATGSWQNNNQWATQGTSNGQTELPSGVTNLPKVKVQEFDSEDTYAIKIEDELVSLVFKDDITYPKVKYWTIVSNIPNPPSPWSIADIDYLMDAQVELNENDNRSSDHLRVGNVQRYVAYNMSDFDAESLKTSSGQVIYVNDPDGKSRFEPLQTNINNFPDDQYYQRKISQMYDMGLPKVNYGSSTSDSGRAKAVDYQSSIDLTQFKRDAWELALQEICEKIQIFGNFLLGNDVDWFQDAEGNFVTRNVEFDWTDILPISTSDKIVNIANKYNMIGMSLKQAYKELGYRNPEAMITELKNELQDPDLAIIHAKAWNLSNGLLQVQNNAAVAQQSNTPQQQGTPTLTSDQNTGTQPQAAAGTTTSYSSANGVVNRQNQNNQAAGR